MLTCESLSFLGGAITVETSGPKQGEGTFAFPEDDLVPEPDDGEGGGPRMLVTIPLSELREMHAWLGKVLARLDRGI